LTAARRMSPVEIWTDPSISVSSLATVPFPAPGAPNKMIFIWYCLHFIFETFEKWLRRGSKIFSAKKMTRQHHDSGQTVNVLSGKAENL
jgi:hypothetical protein